MACVQKIGILDCTYQYVTTHLFLNIHSILLEKYFIILNTRPENINRNPTHLKLSTVYPSQLSIFILLLNI